MIFEQRTIDNLKLSHDDLKTALVLPSNEAVLSADCAESALPVVKAAFNLFVRHEQYIPLHHPRALS